MSRQYAHHRADPAVTAAPTAPVIASDDGPAPTNAAMGCTGEVAVYGDARAAARLLDGMAKIVESEPNRVFADDDVRVSGRRLARLILLRLDGEVADDDDD